MSEKKQSDTFDRKRKARIAEGNEKQVSILKKFIKIENDLSTTVEGRFLTSENFENDNITYCSNQEKEVPVNSTPQMKFYIFVAVLMVGVLLTVLQAEAMLDDLIHLTRVSRQSDSNKVNLNLCIQNLTITPALLSQLLNLPSIG
ncbi:hypothetical protein AVEN_220699-1 [Araneus ventricosus]|uniref:Uncharacterized protein n=1 Tax=Araneus ventricosus TaxID=182803 RepID=A0A4Y2SF60_ARAVE|nr:hypothetical protein AVEN_66556-1 [Araneus ventricosus]GBN85912.1 hypothetical protein AVEN_71193-1 [Araneus ventricosus]GBN85915.1 hypothetical protein AVEN_82955-1 [Araneus ventricosus]GBN85918.1 hypothetical protein AVEN_220699-1 [Araneus ventricosus]